MLHMDSGTSLTACLLLWLVLYEYGTDWMVGCHSWNPLLVPLILINPLMEGYKYNRQSSELILRIQVYTCRILSSIGGTSKITPSANLECI